MSRSFVILAALLVSIAFSHPVNAALVGHWQFDEDEGDIFIDSVGGNDGFLPDGVTVERTGDSPPLAVETSVRFSGDNSFIATEFPGIGAADPRTVAFWLRTTDASAYMVGWGSTNATEKWHIRLNGGSGVMRTEFMGGNNFSGIDLRDGQWHHVASVFPEGATNGDEVLHYVDGVLDPRTGGGSTEVNTALGDGTAPWTDALSTNPYYVHFGGVLGHGFNRWLEGNMADVRIYDEALSETAIQDLFNTQFTDEPADFNRDGVVDLLDYDILADNFMEAGYNRHGDWNQDGDINFVDFIGFADTFQSAGASVPEPSTSLLALLGLAFFVTTQAARKWKKLARDRRSLAARLPRVASLLERSGP